jgi:hypothetical protein
MRSRWPSDASRSRPLTMSLLTRRRPAAGPTPLLRSRHRRAASIARSRSAPLPNPALGSRGVPAAHCQSLAARFSPEPGPRRAPNAPRSPGFRPRPTPRCDPLRHRRAADPPGYSNRCEASSYGASSYPSARQLVAARQPDLRATHRARSVEHERHVEWLAAGRRRILWGGHRDEGETDAACSGPNEMTIDARIASHESSW